MFVCRDCGDMFVLPVVHRDAHAFDYGPYEEYYVCPHCGSNSFEDAPQCNACGGYIYDEYYEINDTKYCPDCVYKGSIFDRTVL